jgi:16S rRNA (uracil1498-N3)-methyltransferase
LVGFSLNLFLLPEQVVQVQWPANDARTHHLKKVLHAQDGDLVDVGVINGPRGKGMVCWQEDRSVKLTFLWELNHASDLLPIQLLVGLSRPQTCRKILEQGAALGVGKFLFFAGDKSEPSYANSCLWHGDEWKNKLQAGVEQAFSSYLPDCDHYPDLASALSAVGGEGCLRLALDIYEAPDPFSIPEIGSKKSACLAIGPERGWSAMERQTLRKFGFSFRHLGPRVLRVETAMVAAVGILASAHW